MEAAGCSVAGRAQCYSVMEVTRRYHPLELELAPEVPRRQRSRLTRSRSTPSRVHATGAPSSSSCPLPYRALLATVSPSTSPPSLPKPQLPLLRWEGRELEQRKKGEKQHGCAGILTSFPTTSDYHSPTRPPPLPLPSSPRSTPSHLSY